MAITTAGLLLLAGKLSQVLNNEQSTWLPSDAESTAVVRQAQQLYDTTQIPTVIAYERSSGLSAADIATAKADLAAVRGIEGVTPTAPEPIIAPDRQAMQMMVMIQDEKGHWEKAGHTAMKIRDKVSKPEGLTVYVTGAGGQIADQSAAFKGIDGRLLYSAMAVVSIALLFTYRSPLLLWIPLISAGSALAVSQAVVYLLASHSGLTVNAQSQGILTVLVFGAGTDYALLLIARYREELRRHTDRHEAMAFALHRAAPAIVASAATVILGMLCLLLADMNSTRGLGPVSAIGIAVALFVTLTLLPALLVIVGRWIFWPLIPRYGSAEPAASGLWARIGSWVKKAPRLIWVTTSLLLALSCLGLTQLNPTGLTSAQSFTKPVESVTGQQLLARHGLTNNSEPIQVIAQASKASEVRAAMTNVPGIAPGEPVVKGELALITAPMPQNDPRASEALALVDQVRTAVHQVPGAQANVGGATAMLKDTQTASQRDNRVVIPVVLVVVLLVLIVLLRALIAPLMLMATVVLSFGAALGLSSLVFRHVLGFAGTEPSFVLYVFVFLVALGIDYNIFLMTRVREESVTWGTRAGSLLALRVTGGVITSAGLVLAGTFLTLGTLPMVAFAEMGIAVAIGVLLDTWVVRSVLVTALNLDLGERIWWPSALARRAGTPPGDAKPDDTATDELQPAGI